MDWTTVQYFRHCALNADRMARRCTERAEFHSKAGNGKLADAHTRFACRFEGRAAAFRHAAEILEAEGDDFREFAKQLG